VINCYVPPEFHPIEAAVKAFTIFMTDSVSFRKEVISAPFSSIHRLTRRMRSPKYFMMSPEMGNTGRAKRVRDQGDRNVPVILKKGADFAEEFYKLLKNDRYRGIAEID